ncbi:UNVERIFIED_CONTAM: hypothetical protein PYX00_009497 [Menopon gallinae]|uniref:Malate dehydrogenase, mitochondrial n=1 Tax=Menopon gallinae TaxID=328185 RepID=A0AAW2HBQ6_9NEOP
MFRSVVYQNLTSCLVKKFIRRYTPPAHREPHKYKVTICGACGQVGQIIGFLLKQSPFVNILSLYDLDNTLGVAMDISHMDTKCRMQSYTGYTEIKDALSNSDVVIICAGVGRAPGMCLNDLFEYNAPVVKQLAEACIEVCPKALLAILTNPINSFVPMVSKMYKSCNVYDPNRIFGVTTIDTMRACSIVTNEVLQYSADPAEFLIPVIGGHSETTCVPVLSQTSPPMIIHDCMIQYLIEKIRCAASLVTNLKESSGGPRLSVALGTCRFVNNLIRGLKNEKDVFDLAYVYTNNVPGVSYFACPIQLGPNGIKQNLGLLRVDNTYETAYLKSAIQHLKYDIKRGESFIG